MIESVAHGLFRGFIHRPSNDSGVSVVLAHGAGSDCNSRLLVSLCTAIADSGIRALRIDLPFRIAGDKMPRNQERDRDGLRTAVEFIRDGGRVVLGGHSYGGRQASMLAAEEPAVADHLLLLSYPLHPPRKPEQLRTAHFPALRTPALFVHGTQDPFGIPDEMRTALPSSAELMLIEGAAHELKPVIAKPQQVLERLRQMLAI